MWRIAKRVLRGIVPVLAATGLAACSLAEPPPPYTMGTGSSMPGPDNIGPPIPVILPPAPVGGNYDRQTPIVPNSGWIIPQAHAAETVRASAKPPSASASPSQLIDITKSPPATGASPDDACIGAWRICHFLGSGI
jgi:hypothetical protein